MGEGKRHHCLSCGIKSQCQSLAQFLVCWNKLALLEGQKWQRWKSPTPNPHNRWNQEEQRGQGHLAEQQAGAMGDRKFINYHNKWCSKTETVEYLLPGEAGRLNIAS